MNAFTESNKLYTTRTDALRETLKGSEQLKVFGSVRPIIPR